MRNGFLIGCGGFGPSTVSLTNKAPVCCGCLAGVPWVWSGLQEETWPGRQSCCCVVGSHVECCEVFVESWGFRTLVLIFPHPSSVRTCSRIVRFWDQHWYSSVSSASALLCHAVIVVLTVSVARHHRLLTLHFHWHVDNLVVRIGPAESLARSDFGHVHVFVIECQGYEVDSSCSTMHLLFPSRVRAGLGRIALISSTSSSFNSLMASWLVFNSPVPTLCHSSHSDSWAAQQPSTWKLSPDLPCESPLLRSVRSSSSQLHPTNYLDGWYSFHWIWSRCASSESLTPCQLR